MKNILDGYEILDSDVDYIFENEEDNSEFLEIDIEEIIMERHIKKDVWEDLSEINLDDIPFDFEEEY